MVKTWRLHANGSRCSASAAVVIVCCVHLLGTRYYFVDKLFLAFSSFSLLVY